MSKPRVHIKTLAGCEGCQDSIAHGSGLASLLEAIDLVECRLLTSPVDLEILPGDIVILEGVPITEEHITLLHEVRAKAALVITIGACAAIGGIPGNIPGDAIVEADIGLHGEKIRSLKMRKGAPVSHYIPVDAVISGCPVSADEFYGTIAKLLCGGKPIQHKYAVCGECRRTGCLLNEGKPCLGAGSSAGCGAVCPMHNRACTACRGLLPGIDVEKLLETLEADGIDRKVALKKLGIFNGFALREEKNV